MVSTPRRRSVVDGLYAGWEDAPAPDPGAAPRRRPVDESPERWRRALARAAGLALYQCSETGAWYCTSGSEPGVVHPVSVEACGCPAGVAGDRVCRHRAALRAHLGLMVPPAPAGDPSDTVSLIGRRCRACGGLGLLIEATPAQLRARGAAIREGRAEPFDAGCPPAVRCPHCGGNGWLPAAPAAEPLAAD